MWLYRTNWEALPRWLQRTTILIGLPAWLAFMAMIFTGAIFTMPNLTMVTFGIFGAVAVFQTLFIARAFWRNDL
ncbi:hypothetical protein ASG20_06915 [Sphingomonas sp. Leaf198]|nr:hypothetical protein ASG20_06915 [Sphingomonas sp. Leaf198]